jgi:hypothetical protein
MTEILYEEPRSFFRRRRLVMVSISVIPLLIILGICPWLRSYTIFTLIIITSLLEIHIALLGLMSLMWNRFIIYEDGIVPNNWVPLRSPLIPFSRIVAFKRTEGPLNRLTIGLDDGTNSYIVVPEDDVEKVMRILQSKGIPYVPGAYVIFLPPKPI